MTHAKTTELTRTEGSWKEEILLRTTIISYAVVLAEHCSSTNWPTSIKRHVMLSFELSYPKRRLLAGYIIH